MARYKISGVPITRAARPSASSPTATCASCATRTSEISRVMTQEGLVTVPPGTTMERAKELLHEHRIEKLLVVDEQGNLRGLITIKDIEKSERFPHA